MNKQISEYRVKKIVKECGCRFKTFCGDTYVEARDPDLMFPYSVMISDYTEEAVRNDCRLAKLGLEQYRQNKKNIDAWLAAGK